MLDGRKPHPVVVVGISGATWRIIDPLTAEGRLPNISRLRSEGASGVLRSVRAQHDKHYRPQVAWPTLASGVLPEKHGIQHFYSDARDAKTPMIWDAFVRHGVNVGLFGWPVTWPPKPLPGFVVPSHLARDDQTWPEELRFIKRLDRQQQSAERDSKRNAWRAAQITQALSSLAKSGLRTRGAARLATSALKALATRDTEKRAIQLRHAKLDLSTDLFLSMMTRYETGFSAFVTFLVDLASHRYWRYREPALFEEPHDSSSDRFRNTIDDAYMHVDRILGRITSSAPPGSIIAVVSEHGMEAEPVSAEIGQWRYVIRGDRLLELVELDTKLQVCPVARWVAFRFPPDRDLQDDVAARLRGVIVEQTGLPLLQVHAHADDEVIVKFNLHRDTEAYVRGNLEELTIRYGDRVSTFTSLTKRLGRQRSGMHDGDGILMIRGPGIVPGGEIRGGTLVDFMPTLLHASGIPVPEGIDGAVLDLFSQANSSS